MTAIIHQRAAIQTLSRTRILPGKSRWLKPLAILCCLVNTVAADTLGKFTYTDNGTSITITDYPDTAVGAVAIPASIIGKPVTSIGANAFNACISLTSVTIPPSVTSIGGWAFTSCTSLTGITLPDSITNIGEGSFYYCTSLTSITLPTGVTSIEDYLFSFCTRLISVVIPDGVTSIGGRAFEKCASLAGITIPTNVTSIGAEAFSSCASLTNIVIPDSVTNLGNWLFYSCTSLVSITLPNSIDLIGNGAFYSCTSLTSITLPDSVTSIGDRAFEKCDSLTSVAISTSVTSIGSNAFYSCSSLTSITLPNSVTSIGASAFHSCTSLASVSISGGLTRIDNLMFYACTSLISITVDALNPAYSSLDGVLFNKGRTTLIDCPEGKVGNYVIPGAVTVIGDFAFYDCKGLTSITIPTSVTSIGERAFYSCTSLPSITIPDSVTSIGSFMFESCTGLTSVTIPTTATSIGNGAFYSCTSLTSITLPDSVTSIGSEAFASCYNLSSVTMGSGVSNVEGYAFYDCRSLAGITLPSSVTSIGDEAFVGCTMLTSATFLGNAPGMGSGVFQSTADGFIVYFSEGRTGFTSPIWMGYSADRVNPSPSVTTGTASGITAVSAILHGTVNPNGLASTAHFEYGLTAAYGSIADVTLAPDNGLSAQAVSASISGLQLGQVYHYRLTATNSGGTGTGEDMTLATEKVNLTIHSLSHGTVTGEGSYAPNTTVEITATPDPAYVFTAWTGDATGAENPLSIMMDFDKTIGATFAPDTSDSDGDGLNNFDEIVNYGTDPALKDTDGDGLTDAWEVGLGRFSIIAGSFTWLQARADALARDGELACFPTADRWNRTMETLGANAFDSFTGLWIGASDASTDGIWTWVNGAAFSFTQWAGSRPSTTSGNTLDYAEVSGGGGAEIGKWYDRSATTIRDGYILETGYATDPLVADADGDGLNDSAEQAAGSNPFKADTDGDGLTDSQEVNLAHTNPKLADSDNNGTNDDQEDPDGDGLTNLVEVTQRGTNPLVDDSDSDGIKDGAEASYAGSFYNLVQGAFTYAQAMADAAAKHGRVASFRDDADYSRVASKSRQTVQGYLWIGLSDAATEGTWVWSDGSTAGYSHWLTGEPSGGAAENHVVIMENSVQWADTAENYVAAGYIFERVGLDPLAADTDADGLTDGQEVNTPHSSPVLEDTDGDGLLDGAEVNTHGSSPLLEDTDSDGLVDRVEVEVYHSNPSLKDSDGDGFDDSFEVDTGFDPAQASSSPDALSSIRTAVEFRFNAANGVSYRIEASADLDNWGTVESDIIGASAVVTRFYSTENQPRRYFRVRRN